AAGGPQTTLRSERLCSGKLLRAVSRPAPYNYGTLCPCGRGDEACFPFLYDWQQSLLASLRNPGGRALPRKVIWEAHSRHAPRVCAEPQFENGVAMRRASPTRLAVPRSLPAPDSPDSRRESRLETRSAAAHDRLPLEESRLRNRSPQR